MLNRYAPLAAFLAAQPTETSTVTLTLAGIEKILGESLSRTAVTRQWWYNSRNRRQPPVWAAAGWQVTQAMMRTASPTITFARMLPDSTAEPLAPERP